MSPIETSKLKKHLSYEDQVRDILREKLISGEFEAGTKLPTSREIAADLGTNSFTVHKAFSALQAEGLIIRYPRRGSFAQKRAEKLTCVGGYSVMSVKEAPFSHAVREALKEELRKEGIEMDLWVDPRPADQRGEPLKSLVKAAEQRRFQAFIATEVDTYTFQWQRKLPVPTAFLAAQPSVPNNVDFDMRQFIEVSLRELARQGCRSVGLIDPALAALHRGDLKGHAGSFDRLEHFTDVAADLGLAIKNDWMHIVCGPLESDRIAPEQERFGHEGFLKMWNQPEKPDGLLVCSEVVARGVILAISEKQVRVPGDLKLALGKNESVDLFCPMPATFVVCSERDIARALIEQVQKQFRGESCERISLPFQLATHTNP